MSMNLQAVVALDDEVDRGLIETLVSGGAGIEVLDYLEVGGPTSSGLGVGDVLIVACAEYRKEVGEYVVEATRQHPARPAVLLCPALGNGFLPDAFAAGLADIVTLPAEHHAEIDPQLSAQLAFAIEKAVVRKRGAPKEGDSTLGRLIAVLGLKGGCGKTLTVANVGVALAQAGHRVALIDLDLQFGDLALAMGLRPERTLYDLVRSGGSLDEEKLEDYLITHSSGARTLLAPVSPEQAGQVTVPFLREVERLLRETHDFVLIDTPPNFTPEVIAAIDASTDVLMVAMRDTLSLKNTKLGLETLERMGYDRGRIRMVLNRANTNVGLQTQDVLAIIGRSADVMVPSHRNVTRSINQGEPIVQQRGSAAGKAFRAIADLYIADLNRSKQIGAGEVPAPSGRRGLLRRRRPEVNHGTA
jgi:pilus assembly protein CpaE